MIKLLYAVAIGVIGAGILHVAALLLLPSFLDRLAWSRLEAVAGLYETTRIDSGVVEGSLILNGGDPSVRAVACRFDLRDGALHVSASGRVPLWSASIYDDSGSNVYSLNDRTTEDHSLAIVVLTPDQMAAVQAASKEDIDPSAYAEVPLDEGILVVRAVAPDRSWEKTVSDFLLSARCGRQ